MRAGIVHGPDPGGITYSSFQQTLTLPRDISRATLRFWYYPISGDTIISPLDDRQYVYVRRADGYQVDVFPMPIKRNDQTWLHHTYAIPLEQFGGQTITIIFGVRNDGDGGLTSMYVDNVRLHVEW